MANRTHLIFMSLLLMNFISKTCDSLLYDSMFNCEHCLKQGGMELKWDESKDGPDCFGCEDGYFNDGRFIFCQKCGTCNHSIVQNCTREKDTVCKDNITDSQIDENHYDKPVGVGICQRFNKEELKQILIQRGQPIEKCPKCEPESGVTKHPNPPKSTTTPPESNCWPFIIISGLGGILLTLIVFWISNQEFRDGVKRFCNLCIRSQTMMTQESQTGLAVGFTAARHPMAQNGVGGSPSGMAEQPNGIIVESNASGHADTVVIEVDSGKSEENQGLMNRTPNLNEGESRDMHSNNTLAVDTDNEQCYQSLPKLHSAYAQGGSKI